MIINTHHYCIFYRGIKITAFYPLLLILTMLSNLASSELSDRERHLLKEGQRKILCQKPIPSVVEILGAVHSGILPSEPRYLVGTPLPEIFHEIIQQPSAEDAAALFAEKTKLYDDRPAYQTSSSFTTKIDMFCTEFIYKDSKMHGSILPENKSVLEWGSDAVKGGTRNLEGTGIESYMKHVFEQIQKLWGHQLNPLDLFHGHLVRKPDHKFYIIFHAMEYPREDIENTRKAKRIFNIESEVATTMPRWEKRNIVLLLEKNELMVVTRNNPLILLNGHKIKPPPKDARHPYDANTLPDADPEIGAISIGSFNYFPGIKKSFSTLPYFNINLSKSIIKEVRSKTTSQALEAATLEQRKNRCACYYAIEAEIASTCKNYYRGRPHEIYTADPTLFNKKIE